VVAKKSGNTDESALATPPDPYDPLDRIDIALSIEGDLLRHPVVPLNNVDDTRSRSSFRE
jgi:hypothetical protein